MHKFKHIRDEKLGDPILKSIGWRRLEGESTIAHSSQRGPMKLRFFSRLDGKEKSYKYIITT